MIDASRGVHGEGESGVVRDAIRWDVAGVHVIIDLAEVFAGLAQH